VINYKIDGQLLCRKNLEAYFNILLKAEITTSYLSICHIKEACANYKIDGQLLCRQNLKPILTFYLKLKLQLVTKSICHIKETFAIFWKMENTFIR
jgi:hypothetical protein